MGTLTWAGLDVHARSVRAAAVIPASGEVRRRSFDGSSSEAVVGWLLSLPQPLRACYEAGPTGFGLARAAEAAGVRMLVVAPSKTPRGSGDRIKTDARDALRLARLLMAGELSAVRVPAAQEEALRDLVRGRDRVRADLSAVQLRISSLLLRQGRVWDRKTGSKLHREWLASQHFEHRETMVIYTDLLAARQGLEHRRQALDAELLRCAAASPGWPTIRRLRAFRGLGTVAATAVHTEIGDWHRFPNAAALSCWLGLVPSVHQSGQQRSSGRTTRAGSKYARRMLVEAALSYRHQPRVGVELAERQVGLPDDVLQLAWRAQLRLYRQHRKLTARAKRGTVIQIAIARQLAGFLWAAAVMPA
jgi:transposase